MSITKNIRKRKQKKKKKKKKKKKRKKKQKNTFRLFIFHSSRRRYIYQYINIYIFFLEAKKGKEKEKEGEDAIPLTPEWPISARVCVCECVSVCVCVCVHSFCIDSYLMQHDAEIVITADMMRLLGLVLIFSPVDVSHIARSSITGVWGVIFSQIFPHRPNNLIDNGPIRLRRVSSHISLLKKKTERKKCRGHVLHFWPLSSSAVVAYRLVIDDQSQNVDANSR